MQSLAQPTTAPAPVEADPTAPTEDHAAVAARAFREGDFVLAAEAFQRAFDITGDPALLFGRAQALRRAGSCAAAIEVFEQFIAMSPPATDAEAAQAVIDECRAILDVHEPPPSPSPVDEDPPPASTSPPPSASPPWHRDVTGGALLGTGLAITAVGAALYGTAFAQADDRGGTEQQYDDRRRRVRTFAATGGALLITGGALVVGSVIRYAVVSKRRSSSRVAWRGPLSVGF